MIKANNKSVFDAANIDWHRVALDGDYQALVGGIESGDCDPETRTNSGASIWHCLAKSGNYTALVQAIMAGRFDPTTMRIPNSGATVWHWLAYGGHYESIVLAIRGGLCNPNTELATKSQGTIWHWLALGGHYPALLQAIKDERCDPETTLTNQGATVWHWLALGGHYKSLAQAINTRVLDPESVVTTRGETIWKHLALSAKSISLAQAILDKRMNLPILKAALQDIRKYVEVMDLLNTNASDNDTDKHQMVISAQQENSDLVYAILIFQIRENQHLPEAYNCYRKLLGTFIKQKLAVRVVNDNKFNELFKAKIEPELWLFLSDDFGYDFKLIQKILEFLIENINQDTIEELNCMLVAYREILLSDTNKDVLKIISPLLAKIYASRDLFASDEQKEHFYRLWDSGLWSAIIPSQAHTTNQPIIPIFSKKRSVSIAETTEVSTDSPKIRRTCSL